MDGALLAARLLLALVFVVAGLGKLADQAGSRQAITDFGLPIELSPAGGFLLPLVELAAAVLLIPKATAFWGGVLASALLAMFTLAIAVNLARGRKPDCHCFGQVASGPIGWGTLVRNAVLGAIAVFIVVQGPNHPGLSAVHWFQKITPTERIGLAVALVTFTLLVAQWGFLMNLLRQNGRLLERIETAENAITAIGSQSGEPQPDLLQQVQPQAPPQPVFGLPVGTSAPPFNLSGLYGETITLDSLRAQAKPIMLLFTDPGCGPCGDLLPDIARWQREEFDKVTVALLSRGSADANRTKMVENGVRNVLLQQGDEVAVAYQSPGTPSAVVIGADGTISTPMSPGPEPIRQLFMSQIAAPAVAAPAPQALAGAPVPFLDEMPTPAPIQNGGNGAVPAAVTTKVGDPAPSIELKDLDNKRVNLSELNDGRHLLVFWSLGCGFCQQMLPDLKEWEKNRPDTAPNVVLVSSGSVEDNRAMALKSTVLLDPNFQAGQALGAQGTPMGVVIENGRIASEVAAGAPAVFELAGGAPPGSASASAAAPAGVKVGERPPAVALKDLDDKPVDLSRLQGENTMLLFWGNTCGFCQQMLPDFKEWEANRSPDAPRVMLISGGSVEENRNLGLQSTILLDTNFQAGTAFGASGTPMGVLIDSKGFVASEVAAGAPGVFGLLGGSPNGASPDGAVAAAAMAGPLKMGDSAPPVKLQDLNDKTVNLSDFKGSMTLLLFWSNGCGFCQQMLPDLKEWEKNKPKGAPKLLVVSGGSVEENRALGLKSPIVLDQNFQVGPIYGANGTPMGVLIDEKGNIASEVAAGGEAVLKLASGAGGAHPVTV
jgi:peroxiredoxin/uncharacterized membrane protein YphA (DoxX/SURF4 family)